MSAERQSLARDTDTLQSMMSELRATVEQIEALLQFHSELPEQELVS